MTATDAVGVTACIITESSSKPLASDPWIAVTSTTSYSTTSASYSAATPGAKTLYAWARDAAGNISTSRSASITITATIDGAALYGTNCASCHNPLATSTKKGRSANQIQLAIDNNTGGMGSSSLRGLTAAQIDAIAAALTVAAPVLTTVNVTPPTASINPGATRQLAASPLDQNGAAFAGATIAWSSNNSPVATVNATTGLVTGVSVGTATVTATATSGATTKTGTSVITVTAAALVLTTVNVTPPTASINPGATRQLTASPLDQNGAAFAGATIAWSSNNSPVATVNATTGLVTGVSVGTATVTATATSGATTKTGTSVITVTAATPPDGAALYGTNCASCHNPLATSTKKGRSANQIQLAINNNTGGMGSSSLRGLTAAQIDAIAAALTVAAPVLTTVNVTPPTASINPGATRQLAASPLDQNGAAFAGATIAWSSNNSPVATVNATTGLVTGVSVGTATVTATATSGATTKTGTSVITVTAAALVLTTVNVTPPTASINPGATRQLTASPLDQNGAAFAGATIAWSSNNSPVATVNATTGLVTGVSVGTATVTATATSGATTKTGTSVFTVTAATPPDGAALYGTNCASCHNPLATSTKKGRSANQIQLAINNNTGGMGSSSLRGLTAAQIDAIAAALTVAAPVLTTVNVTPPTASINPGATRQLAASPLDQNGAAFAGATIAWSSNNSPVATVNATTGLVTGVSVGTATVTATATSGATTKTGTSVITVTAATPPDGAALYGTNCASCHNPLATSTKKGRSANQIQLAINNNTGGMGSSSLRGLTAAQIDAIAAALLVAQPSDTTAPTITEFGIPASSSSLTVSITTFTANDDVGVTGYLVTESSTKPSASAGGWSATPPPGYTCSATGAKTLYAWAKDAAGNVSPGVSATTTVSASSTAGPDMTVWVGKWFKITERNTGYHYAEPALTRTNSSYTVYLNIWNWDPVNKVFQVDRYEQDGQTGQWFSDPLTLYFIAGTQFDFLCWSGEETDNHMSGFTARIQGYENKGELQRATFKTMGGYYVELTNASGSGSQSTPSLQNVGGLSFSGALAPEGKVPVPRNIFQH